ncbi:MAG TPA: glucan biosynthesis protein G [Gammaproteobacteria bacterium]|nr:glucan biosynthesis protein G [Gammaproteobacteria bacterium]
MLVILVGPCVPAHAFDLRDVVAKAKALAARSYQAPTPIPKFLRELSFDEYQGIRFNPDRSLWRTAHARFQVMLVPPGLYYTNVVRINVVDGTGVHRIPFQKDDFDFSSQELEKRIPADLGYAGFKLTYPLNGPKVQNQFLVFAGASYFRGVGKGNAFGLSARGVAVDTGLPSGEEFPSFIEYWLVRPSADAHAMTFYALLNGKSLTGAYRFTVYPGSPTMLQVKVVLFPRAPIQLPGIAPLTSMFFYGANTARPPGEWRPQVHDSDGLLIHNGGTGEWLWRPLLNPKQLQMYYFNTENVRGFGLLQRETGFSDYQDPGARYDERPSAWVAPQGDWGKGQVILLELPASAETNDNMVAFWSPSEKADVGKPMTLSYDLSFGDDGVAKEPMGYAAATFVGNGNIIGGGSTHGAYRVIVDFAGGPLATLAPTAPVVGQVTALDGGKLMEHYVEYVRPTRRWRLSILAKPAPGQPLSLRAFLQEDKKTLTETWTYHLPVHNDIVPGGG